MLSDAEATNAISSYRASMDLVHPDSAARRARATPRDSNQSRRLCLTWAAHDAEAKLRALAKLCPLEAVTEVDRLFDLLPILEPAIGGRDLVAARTITTQAAIDFYRTDDLLKTERAAARARVQDAFTSSAAIITGRMTERLVAFRHEHKIYTVAEASRARTESKKGPALLPYLSSLREARKESLRPVARPFAPNTAPQVGP